MSFPPPADAHTQNVWIDGCFDFAHHGHAGAMLQARQVGKALFVGVHSDEEILRNKGPTVMKLPERMCAVSACKWCDQAVPNAPYVTEPEFMDKYHCKYAVHGDDITTDADGNDCYRIVKDLGRFIVVKRTPSISTTDLVGRMLLGTKTHHTGPVLQELLAPHHEIYSRYASDETGLAMGQPVYLWDGSLKLFVEGKPLHKKPGKILYVPGLFDLFHPGHIELLKIVYTEKQPEDIVVVGIADDAASNALLGLNYPVMTLVERLLCALLCRYYDVAVLGAPIPGSEAFYQLVFETFGSHDIEVLHGPGEHGLGFETSKGWCKSISHKYDDITTQVIVERVLGNRREYEERQRRKGWKGEKEKELEEVEKGSKR